MGNSRSGSQLIVLKASNILKGCHSLKQLDDDLIISTDNDPHMYIQDRVGSGFYLVRYNIKIDTHRSAPRLYYSSIEDCSFTEEKSLCLPDSHSASSQPWSILYLETDSLLRFDPVDQECTFSFNHFSIISCSSLFARRFLNRCLADTDQTCIKTNGREVDISLFRRYSKAQEAFFANQRDNQTIKYADWIKQEQLLFEQNERFFAELPSLNRIQPLISIILPVYNIQPILLRECINSVISQTYSNWELCISDDNSPNQAVRDLIVEHAEKDSRIKYVFRGVNGHISANSNSALELAHGEYIALLDHDDLLSPHALRYIVAAINAEPMAGIIYTDEDKIDEDGNRLNPHFKSAFNFHMLLCQNYICHLLCIKSSIVRHVNGFDLGAEGCQDHILLLKASIECAAQSLPIVHIPLVLYHWRMTAGSTALDAANKSYTTSKYISAVEILFAQKDVTSLTVSTGALTNIYNIKYNVSTTSPPLVSIIIPTRNAYDYTKRCYDSIIKHNDSYPHYEIIIVDNQSDDPRILDWFNLIATNSHTSVLRYDDEFNYSAINNFAARNASGDILLLLNNDTEVISSDWLKLLVSHASREDVGCVGAMLLYDDNTIQHAGVILGIGGVAGHSHKNYDINSYGYHSRLLLTQELSAVTAACLAIRKEVYLAVGGLDEVNLRVAFNDIDFCLRVQEQGYKNIFEPHVRLYHYESKSRGKEDTPLKQARFESEVGYMKERWAGLLLNDMYYNPNLSDTSEDFSIGIPNFSIKNLPFRSVTPCNCLT